MELQIVIIVLSAMLVSVLYVVEARPKLSIRQIIRKDMERIWMDYDGKKPKKRMRIKEFENVKRLTTDDVFSNCRAVRFQPGQHCQHLVYEDGALFGTDRQLKDNEGVFQIETYGMGIVRIKYVQNGLYLMMNRHGRINATNDKSNSETLFHHLLEEGNSLYTFASAKYYMVDKMLKNGDGNGGDQNLLIGVKGKKNDRCKVKNAKNTLPENRSDQFIFGENDLDQSLYCQKNPL